MAGSRTLQTLLDDLEVRNELIRVAECVSPVLDIAERAVRESLRPAPSTASGTRDCEGSDLGGRALRFEQVEGCDFPLVINVYGSAARMNLALRCESEGLESIGHRIEALTRLAPPAGLRDFIARGKQVIPLLRAAPRSVRAGVCQEVVRRSDQGQVDLRRLPLIKCWPLDGDPAAVGWPLTAEQAGTSVGQGRYITFAGMHTIHARDRGAARPQSHNVGMYRAQLIGPTQLAMHWHVHHDGAAHWRSWKAAGVPMPIAICLGGEPVLPYAATAPLPPGMSELLLAGYLEGRGIPMVKAQTVPLRVPANSEIVIEGYVRTDAGACGWDPNAGESIGDGAVLEGPFGDHTGFYSLPDRYPVVDVTAVTHRRNAVFPATVVGPPPQEDYWLGKATERIFLPLLRTLIPDLVDYNLPMAGCFHNWAVLGIRKEYALQARRVMHAVWGAGQMAWTKCLLVVDADEVDVHNQDAVLAAMFRNVDFARSVELTLGPLDILDHAAVSRGAGGKIGFDATRRRPGEADGPPVAADLAAIRSQVPREGVRVPDWGCGRCIIAHGDVDPPDGWTGLIIMLDADVDLDERMRVWFHTLASIDPSRDVDVSGGVMRMDARMKPTADRPWPPFLGWEDPC